jgi:integrase/recombinase XerD
VLSHVPEVHRPIVMIIFYHGLRMIEARTQKRSDYKRGLLTVRTRKGGPDRVIALEPEVIEAIEATPPAIHGCLFHYAGKPYSKSTLWKVIREALDAAGFQDISPNAAGRHSFGSQRTQRGQPTRSLQEEMGHSDIRTTEIYTHCTPTLTWGRTRKKDHPSGCSKGV